jgi:hypothetical protein
MRCRTGQKAYLRTACYFKDGNMLRKICATALLSALALGVSSSPAMADTHKFKITNEGGHQIDHVYISPIASKKWGPDQLDNDQVISPGKSVTWDIDTDCEMDVMVVYHDGTKKEHDDFDTCKYDMRASY